MREAIGGTWLFGLVITFIVFFASFLAISVNYSKAFNVKNNIVDMISKYEGNNCNARNKNEIEKINKSLESDGGKGRKMVKSTPYGTMYQDLGEDNNKAAFVTRFILPIIIISLSLLIPLLSIILANK